MSPAEDYDRTVLGSYKASRVNPSLTETYEVKDYAVSLYDFEHHPASVTAERFKGFRKCANWSHRGRHMIVSSGSATVHMNYPTSYWKTLSYDGSIWNLGIFPDPALASPNQINRTLVKALNRLKNQDFHLGNFIATARETTETVANGFSHIARSVTGFRRACSPKTWGLITSLEGRVPRKSWCKIPSAWLELQYGWTPLLQDIFGALTHLQRESRYGIPYVSVKASTEEPYGYTVNAYSPVPGVSGQVSLMGKQRCDVFLVYGVTNPLLAELSSLGLINPAEIVWEVLPYSFVVDWALPISDWLSALTGDIGYSFITGGQSRTTKIKQVSGTVSINPQVNVNRVEIKPPAVHGSAFNFERTCYGSTPVPGTYVKSPISLTHVANALSLLVQAFR